MVAAKADWHEIMKSRLTRALARSLPSDLRLFVEPSVTLSPVRLLEPDLAVRQTIRVHRDPVDNRCMDVSKYEKHEPAAALLAGMTIRLDELD